MKDMFGNEIKVGKMVAYPVRWSSRMWMSYGRVTEVVEGEPHLKVRIGAKCWWDSKVVRKPKIVKVVKLDRVIVIPHTHFNEEDREFFGLLPTYSDLIKW